MVNSAQAARPARVAPRGRDAIRPQNPPASGAGEFSPPPTLPLPSVPHSRPGSLLFGTRSRLLHPIAATLHDPMLRNGHALIFSSSITQVIGVFYWIVAARAYPAA